VIALHDCRDAFANTLAAIMATDERFVVVANDSIGSSKLTVIKREYATRVINVGIAEQAMVGVAAGLANAGHIPFVCAASPFLTARAMEQIKVDVAYSRANVKLCGMSSGMAYGPLGPTHHSIEDLAWTRAIADLTVIVPADLLETEQVVRTAAATEGPMYLRISRSPVPQVHADDYQFEIGRAALLRQGEEVTLIAAGTMVWRALQGAEVLAAEGIEARVLNMATIQPLDRDAVVRAAVETGAIVTVEEHTVHGGLGSAVVEVVASSRPVPVNILGVPSVFAPTGSDMWLFDHFGLTGEGVADAARAVLQRKQAA
jgi:transketolase